MNVEKAQKDFDKLIAVNGFALAGHTSDTGIHIYHRMWTRIVEVVWYGEQMFASRNIKKTPKRRL